MFYKLRRKMMVRKFNAAIKEIFATPPMPVVQAPILLVSMVSIDDLPMYVLAMKAFYRRVGRGAILALVAADELNDIRAVLTPQFPGIEFVVRDDIDTGPCQRGGCWERLLYILDRAATDYVVQIDSDTLPVADDLREVVDCIEAGVAFVMADNQRRIQSMRDVAMATQRMQTDYIGVVAERQFDRYPDCDQRRYVRGSAGFSGFAPGGTRRAEVEEFHGTMEQLLGATRWREWGTEQCASNFAVANSPGAVVLPYPAYTSFVPDGPRHEAKFFHFIGTHRFDEGYFAARGRAEIAALRTAPHRMRQRA